MDKTLAKELELLKKLSRRISKTAIMAMYY